MMTSKNFPIVTIHLMLFWLIASGSGCANPVAATSQPVRASATTVVDAAPQAQPPTPAATATSVMGQPASGLAGNPLPTATTSTIELSETRSASAVLQPFERGMLWYSYGDEVIILFNYTDGRAGGEWWMAPRPTVGIALPPEYSAVPPSLYAPDPIFSSTWLFDYQGLIAPLPQSLGWATGPSVEYQSRFACTRDVQSSLTRCAFTMPDSRLVTYSHMCPAVCHASMIWSIADQP